MLSDGSASSSRFNSQFDNKDTYIENYNNLKFIYSPLSFNFLFYFINYLKKFSNKDLY